MAYANGPEGLCGKEKTYFSKLEMGYDWPFFPIDQLLSVDFSSFLPHFGFVKIAVAFALSIGLFFWENGAPKKIHLRSIIYLFLPFPLLWWVPFSQLFPSRYWNLWKAFLFIFACLTLILAFFSSQPIVDYYPVYAKKNVQRIEIYDQYQIVRNPNESTFYFGWANEAAALKLEGDSWHNDQIPISLEADEGSYDFPREVVHVLDTQSNNLFTFFIDPLKLHSVHSIPKAKFPVQGEFLRQALDPETNTLFASHRDGFLISIDLNNYQVTKTILLQNPDKKIWRLQIDTKRGELFVLTERSIYVFRSGDLKILRRTFLPGRAFDMMLDLKRNRILVGLPSKLRLLSLDCETFEIKSSVRVSAGIRALAIDEDRNLLFLGYISGLLEIRRLSDFQLIDKVRLIPWTRRIALLPEIGTLAVSGRGCPVVWQYEPLDIQFDMGIWGLRAIDWIVGNFADRGLPYFHRGFGSQPLMQPTEPFPPIDEMSDRPVDEFSNFNGPNHLQSADAPKQLF